MSGALNQLVGNRQWIPTTRTLIENFLALVFFIFRSFGHFCYRYFGMNKKGVLLSFLS